MHAAARGEDFAQWLRAPILPGRLGASAPVLALVFALAGALSVFAADRFEHASACGRCGRRICARCDGTVWNSVTCENCHRLFSQPETTDPVMRVARLGELRDRERRLERLIRVGSLLVPGVGGMAAGRPDRAFISILLFGWTVAALLWRNGVVPDPLVVGASGPLLLMATASLTGIGYVAIVVSNMSLRRQL
jgi:hypothetical protein